jgi:hypothetical protein
MEIRQMVDVAPPRLLRALADSRLPNNPSLTGAQGRDEAGGLFAREQFISISSGGEL